MSEKMPETLREKIALNPFQGDFKRILCVCSGGILRSPTAAWVLGQEPYNANTRAAGTKDYALIPVDHDLLNWADEIVVMEHHHQAAVIALWNDASVKRSGFYPKDEMAPVKVLNIPDIYAYREPELIARIKRSYDKETK